MHPDVEGWSGLYLRLLLNPLQDCVKTGAGKGLHADEDDPINADPHFRKHIVLCEFSRLLRYLPQNKSFRNPRHECD